MSQSGERPARGRSHENCRSRPGPPEVQALIERRRATGADLYDELWEGVYHLVPGPHTRHANVQGQLLAQLHGPARRAGLSIFGPLETCPLLGATAAGLTNAIQWP